MEYADIVDVLQKVQNNNSREWYRQQKAVFREVHQTLTNLYFSVADQIRRATAIDIVPRKMFPDHTTINGLGISLI